MVPNHQPAIINPISKLWFSKSIYLAVDVPAQIHVASSKLLGVSENATKTADMVILMEKRMMNQRIQWRSPLLSSILPSHSLYIKRHDSMIFQWNSQESHPTNWRNPAIVFLYPTSTMLSGVCLIWVLQSHFSSHFPLDAMNFSLKHKPKSRDWRMSINHWI